MDHGHQVIGGRYDALAGSNTRAFVEGLRQFDAGEIR